MQILDDHFGSEARAVVGSQVGWESKAARQLKLELKMFPKGSMYPITRYLGFGQ